MPAITPREAFVMLCERRIREIGHGRTVQEITSPELKEMLRLQYELLRLRGYPIPRFDSEDAEMDWLRDEGMVVLRRADEEDGDGKEPLSVGGRA